MNGSTMIKPLVLLAALVALGGCATPVRPAERSDVDVRATPLEVVNRRMSAYNRHDLDALLATYSDSVEVFTFPDDSLGAGKDHMRWVFEGMFEEGIVHVDVHHQLALDGYVVNHETVNYGFETVEYVSVYEVRDGLIETVTFVRD